MKPSLLFTFFVSTQILLAQTFTEVPPPSDFEGITAGAIAFADVDGDGDSDVLIAGLNSSSESTVKLYTNDGTGSYSEVMDTPFEGGYSSSIAFADVDGDGDSDVLITGRDNSLEQFTKLYTNDGTGSFTQVMGTPFDGVWFGSVAFSDVDGDGDSDVLVTGVNNSLMRTAKLYTNDGTGIFTEVIDTPFDAVLASSIAFSDVDGDGDSDVLITGESDSGQIAKLYINDGTGSYSEVIDTPFEGVVNSSIAFSDVDGDGDSDVLITGENNPLEGITKLYTNDGLGSFTEVINTNFEGVWLGSIAFSDVDGDGDSDVLITGQKSPQERIAKLYTNDGTGVFTEVMGTNFDRVYFSSIAFSDVNGDGNSDVLITGRNNSSERIAKLYIGDGLGNYPVVLLPPFEGLAGSIAFSDVDGDGDSDVLMIGFNNSGARIAKLYTNDGMGVFTEVMGTPFDAVSAGSIAFSDVDGDGDSDVLITGQNGSERIAKLYINDGTGSYTEVMDTPFDGVSLSSIAFSDVDGDGNSDVLITGQSGSGPRIAKLYTNDGMGNYTEVIDTPFDGVTSGSIAFSDVDGDGDNDVLITGVNGIGPQTAFIAKLYTNDGAGSYTQVMDTPFDGITSGSIAFSDVDGDGDSDVLITGRNNPLAQIAKLYTNDGTGSYSEAMDTPFDGVMNSSIAFSDVDGDGDSDVLITGRNNSLVQIAKLYINDGTGNYTELMGTPFTGVSGTDHAIAFSDIDGDGDSDVLITGEESPGERIAKLYTNDGFVTSWVDKQNILDFDFVVYPNPTTATQLNINYQANENSWMTIQVFDLNGRQLIRQQRRATSGEQTFSINITSLIPGSYFIELGNGKRRGLARFIVQ